MASKGLLDSPQNLKLDNSSYSTPAYHVNYWVKKRWQGDSPIQAKNSHASLVRLEFDLSWLRPVCVLWVKRAIV